jgi:hypothetical protein
LGEFSPNGRLFFWVGILKITEVAHIFGHLSPWLRLCTYFEKYIGLHKFWAIYSQTQLVTLIPVDMTSGFYE